MKFSLGSLFDYLKNLRNRQWSINLLTFLGFAVLAAIFWFVMAMNDNMQATVNVKLKISNAPDTVTFISIPPEVVHVTVRDKGTSIFRAGRIQSPEVNLNFRDYAQDGVFRVSKNDFQQALKSVFSQDAVITSSSLDSLRLDYTTNRGKLVPVVVDYSVSAVSGMTTGARPACDPELVKIYADQNVLDTINRVYTEQINRKNLDKPTVVDARLKRLSKVRIIPDQVTVTFNVEALVKKESQVSITLLNVPDDRELLVFPQKATVEYYVPMSRFSKDNTGFVVTADYHDLNIDKKGHVPLHLDVKDAGVANAVLVSPSVEYTVVKKR